MCRVLVTYIHIDGIKVFNIVDDLKAVSVNISSAINNKNLEFITFVDEKGLVSIRKEHILQIQVVE